MTPLEHLNALYRAMPPVAAMHARAFGFDEHALRVLAPLADNLNDKGSAFGGSLSSLMTLAGWGLLTLRLHAAGLQADVYVADSQVRFLRPLREDLVAEARLEAPGDWPAVLRTLRERGRARAGVLAQVRAADGQVAAEFSGRFAALRGG